MLLRLFLAAAVAAAVATVEVVHPPPASKTPTLVCDCDIGFSKMGEKGSVLNHLFGFYPPIFGVCSFVNRSYCCTVWLVCF